MEIIKNLNLTQRDEIALEILKAILYRGYHDMPERNVIQAYEHADEFLKKVRQSKEVK